MDDVISRVQLEVGIAHCQCNRWLNEWRIRTLFTWIVYHTMDDGGITIFVFKYYFHLIAAIQSITPLSL